MHGFENYGGQQSNYGFMVLLVEDTQAVPLVMAVNLVAEGLANSRKGCSS